MASLSEMCVVARPCALLAGNLTDGMAVTSAGKLPCTKIFHLFAKPSTKAWKDVIGRCFAEAERLKLTSLAMPPLGTGKF